MRDDHPAEGDLGEEVGPEHEAAFRRPEGSVYTGDDAGPHVSEPAVGKLSKFSVSAWLFCLLLGVLLAVRICMYVCGLLVGRRRGASMLEVYIASNRVFCCTEEGGRRHSGHFGAFAASICWPFPHETDVVHLCATTLMFTTTVGEVFGLVCCLLSNLYLHSTRKLAPRVHPRKRSLASRADSCTTSSRVTNHNKRCWLFCLEKQGPEMWPLAVQI